MSDLHALDLSFNMPVCGIDEVGRGPLAGPVMAACVHIPSTEISKAPLLLEMTDSKKLTLRKREELFTLIKEYCVWGLGEACHKEIDKINILQATFEAMRRAAANMKQHAKTQNIDLDKALALIDGNKIPPRLGFANTQSIVKGDSKSLSIAAASILAKVTRDRYMAKLALEYPHYGWESNAGYGAPKHKEAIEIYGPSPYHRMSFAPLKHMELP